MRVMVPGGCGYIGAQLVPVLLSRGHTVSVVDEMWFGGGSLPRDNDRLSSSMMSALPENVEFENHDAVIDLAGMTNNSMCELNPVLDHQNNRVRFDKFTRSARSNGIKHFIYASSLAAYGSTKTPATEDTPLRPTTLYGASKAYCESQALRLQSDEFAVTIVRAASVVGASMNMRFDTTMNKMTHDAERYGQIQVNGGIQVRTHVSIKDLCDFYCLCLESKETHGQVYNVVDKNMTVGESAELVAGLSGASITYGGRVDQRSYVVDGAKARVIGWEPKHGIENAVRDILVRLRSSYWEDSTTNDKYQRMRYDIA